jgi:hypothetical protein
MGRESLADVKLAEWSSPERPEERFLKCLNGICNVDSLLGGD